MERKKFPVEFVFPFIFRPVSFFSLSLSLSLSLLCFIFYSSSLSLNRISSHISTFLTLSSLLPSTPHVSYSHLVPSINLPLSPLEFRLNSLEIECISDSKRKIDGQKEKRESERERERERERKISHHPPHLHFSDYLR